jgi:type II secretory pathway component PulF
MISPLEIAIALGIMTTLFSAIGLKWLLNGIALSIPQAFRTLWHQILTIISWLLLFAALVMIAYSLLGVPSLVMLMIMGIVFADAMGSYWRAEYKSLYATLYGILQRHIPLAAGLRQYAAERRDALGRRAAIVASRIEAGEPEYYALQLLVPRRDLDTILALRFVPETNNLASALQPRSAVRTELEQTLRSVRNLMLYVCLLVFSTGALLSFVAIRITPVMAVLLSTELGQNAQPSQLESFLMDVIPYLEHVPLLLLVLALCALAAWGLHVTTNIWRSVPLVNRWDQRLDRARILEMLAPAVERQRSLRGSLEKLGEIYPKGFIRRRLHKVAGRDRAWWELLGRLSFFAITPPRRMRSAGSSREGGKSSLGPAGSRRTESTPTC